MDVNRDSTCRQRCKHRAKSVRFLDGGNDVRDFELVTSDEFVKSGLFLISIDDFAGPADDAINSRRNRVDSKVSKSRLVIDGTQIVGAR